MSQTGYNMDKYNGERQWELFVIVKYISLAKANYTSDYTLNIVNFGL